MFTRRNLITSIAAAGAAILTGQARSAETGTRDNRSKGGNYFPNCVLTTHEGKRVHFYEDLIRDRLVAINMMFAQCDGICPTMTSNLQRVQKLLGDRVGKDIFMYSITLLPEQDTPQRLNEYVEMHGVKPGWQFLTGARADIESIRYKLGFYDLDPNVDKDPDWHTGMLRLGNDAYDRWIMTPALSEPEQIIASLLLLDRTHVGRVDPRPPRAVPTGAKHV